MQPEIFRRSVPGSGNYELVSFTGGVRLAAGELLGMGLKGTKFGKSGRNGDPIVEKKHRENELLAHLSGIRYLVGSYFKCKNMKAIISNIFIFLLPTLIFGQYGHDRGIIITKKLDTIYCLVPIKINYSGTILIKFPEDNSTREINSDEIKYLATKYNVFENIKFIEKETETERMMRFVVEGYVNLYLNSY